MASYTNQAEKVMLDIKDLGPYGLSKSIAYGMARRGELPGSIRIGRRILIHRATLESWLAEQARIGGSATCGTRREAGVT